MGAILKLSKMPESCRECIFAEDDVTYCRLRKSQIIAGRERRTRMPLCPLQNEGQYLNQLIKSGINLKRWNKMGFKQLFGKEAEEFDAKGSLHLYTDGSCLGNGTPNSSGGWAYILIQQGSDEKFSNHGNAKGVTNNQMEMLAALWGLRKASQLNTEVPITLYSDSKYVIETLKGNFKIKKNQELWRELLIEVRKFRAIRFEWVKGHADNEYNIAVDRMATQESASV